MCYQHALLVLGLALLTGCVTAKLPPASDAFAPQDRPGQAKVGVARVKDARASVKVGHIGAASISVKKPDLENLVTSHLMDCFNRQLGVNVERVSAETAEEAKLLADSRGVDGLVLASILNLTMTSVDAVMEPVEVALDVEVSLHDQTGRQIFKEVVLGRYSKWIGITIVDKATGKLVDATTRAFAEALANRLNSQGVLRGLK